jgi:hypothetical protein
MSLALVAAAVMATAPQAVLADAVKAPDSRSIGEIAEGDSLLVTFADRPDRDEAERRLRGIGAIRPSLPEEGIWEVSSAKASSARALVLARPGVVRTEWALVRTTDDLTRMRPTPPATLPLLTAVEPIDPLYANAGPAQQWSLRLGNWSPGLGANARPAIAILDSGVDSTHEEWRNSGALFAPRSTLRSTGVAEDIAMNGHGTHVAGIAAAPANGVGVVGVAPAAGVTLPDSQYGPGQSTGVSKLIPVQIADPLGRSTDGTIIRGIRWAVNNGAKVINISSGGPGYSQAFQDTVNWAYKRGAVIISSVGNEGDIDNPVNFPAGYDHVIGVGALCDATVDGVDCTTPYGRAQFSNYNYSVDLLAPGVNIPSSIPISVHEREISPGYGFKDGTSMAAPYVAGVAALVYASHPGISPFQVTRILESTAARWRSGRNNKDGWGAVNPLAAAQAQAPMDDLAEPNDDVKWLPKRDTIRVTRTPVRLRAWADFNDDQFDTVPVLLRKGERMRVTLAARRGRLAADVYRPGATSVSFRSRSRERLAATRLGGMRRTTPGTRSVVVRARETGRHFIAIEAVAGGGEYTLQVQRL